jgi:hypothetical protein
MKGDDKLGWGYWVIGFFAVIGIVFWWNTVHPFFTLPNPFAKKSRAQTEAIASQPAQSPVTVSSESTPPATATTSVAASATDSSTTAATDASAVINYMDLVQNRDNWPKMVRLKKDVTFAVLTNGVPSGSVTAPVNSEVQLIKVAGDKSLVVQLNSAQSTVNADDTNFEELVTQNIRAAAAKSNTVTPGN